MPVYGSSILVDCSAGTVHPITGCSDPDAPVLSGTVFELILADSSDWFSGNVLPASIPAFGDLLAVVGTGESWGAGVVVADAEFAFSSLTTPAVPALGPVGVALVGSLLGLLGVCRLRSVDRAALHDHAELPVNPSRDPLGI